MEMGVFFLMERPAMYSWKSFQRVTESSLLGNVTTSIFKKAAWGMSTVKGIRNEQVNAASDAVPGW